jgi:hypothetical protein
MGRKPKNAVVHVLPPKELELSASAVADLKQKERSQPVQQFKTLPEQLAKSMVYHKNWYVPELREQFKYLDRMRRIDMVFPYARLNESGCVMLLVDLPATPEDVKACELKRTMLGELGYRYCYLEDDSTLFDALNQLGEI